MVLFPIIGIVLIVRLALNIINKPSHNVLACGIFGWAGSDVSLFNLDKFNILGVFNVARGKDSCGVTVDGDAFYGIDKNSEYQDFIRKQRFIPELFPVVFGHTRAASLGNKVNVDNAHPFIFFNEEKETAFGGVHNGTLYNANELAVEYGIVTTVNSSDGSVRTKIDSEILLEILYKTGTYEVLSKYQGAAALIWTRFDEPDTIYLFKGASKATIYANHEVEERPLCYYMESANNIYVSSLFAPLEMIGGDIEKNIFTLDENQVYKIKNGDIENAERFIISRQNCTHTKPYVQPTSGRSSGYSQTHYGHHSHYDDYDDLYGYSIPDNTQNSKNNRQLVIQLEKENISPSNLTSLTNLTSLKKDLPSVVRDQVKLNLNILDSNLLLETPILHDTSSSQIYFNQLRYLKYKQRITGIAVFIPGYGFYLLKSKDSNIAKNEANALRGLFFTDGEFIKDAEYYSDINIKLYADWIPFKDSKDIPVYYFIDGVRIRTALDYVSTIAASLAKIEKNVNIDELQLSHISAHPIMDVQRAPYRYAEYQNIYLDGVKFSGNIAPLGSERIYSIENGNLTRCAFNYSCIKNLHNENYEVLRVDLETWFIVDDLERTEELENLKIEINSKFDEFLNDTFLNAEVVLEDLGEDFTVEEVQKDENLNFINNRLKMIKSVIKNVTDSKTKKNA